AIGFAYCCGAGCCHPGAGAFLVSGSLLRVTWIASRSGKLQPPLGAMPGNLLQNRVQFECGRGSALPIGTGGSPGRRVAETSTDVCSLFVCRNSLFFNSLMSSKIPCLGC